MSDLKTVVSWIWKILVCGVTMAFGVMLGAAVATALGFELPRFPGEVDQNESLLLLLLGGMVFAAGLAVLNAGLAGHRRSRWVVLATFGFVIHGIGNTLEGSIFSTLGGEPATLMIRLLSTLLCAFAVVLLFDGAGQEGLREKTSLWLSRWTPAKLAVRLGLAVAAFPVIYFSFGVMIVPIVTPHYEALDFLVIPPLSTILTVLFIRSVLLLAGSLPVIAVWSRSRGQLIFALALGHFVAVGLTDLIQASFFPAVLRWTHSAEILVDSVVYAAALTWLLIPRTDHRDEPTRTMMEQPA